MSNGTMDRSDESVKSILAMERFNLHKSSGWEDKKQIVEEAMALASSKVSVVLTKYKSALEKVVKDADIAATKAFNAADTASPSRAISVYGNTWKKEYEVGTGVVEANWPLAQKIIAKFLANFN